MKFKSDTMNLIVWDAKKSKELCRFKNGECETSDKRTIDILLESGYESDDEKSEDLDIDELRQEAKEKGIKNWHNMKPENLIEKLRGGANEPDKND